MKVYVMGDIHGAVLSLKQCLERSEFDKKNDMLIQLGDVCDGFPYVYECVEELLTIENLVAIKGNHDEWFWKWLTSGVHPDQWIQGGMATLKSYRRNCEKKEELGFVPDDIPNSHFRFFGHQLLYYKDEFKNLFVHAGFNRHIPLRQNADNVLYWDRELFMEALSYKPESDDEEIKFKMYDNWNEVFIGHTTTEHWGNKTPMHAANIWNLDTGVGNKSGKLTIMNVDSKEFFQSDTGKELYPEDKGR